MLRNVSGTFKFSWDLLLQFISVVFRDFIFFIKGEWENK